MGVLERALAPSSGKARRWRWASLSVAGLALAALAGQSRCGADDQSNPPQGEGATQGVTANAAGTTGEAPPESKADVEATLPPIPEPADGCEAITLSNDVDPALAKKQAEFLDRLMTSTGRDDPNYPDFLTRRGVHEAEAGDVRTACRTFAAVIGDFRSSEFAGKAQCLERRLCQLGDACPEGTAGDPVMGCSISATTCSSSSFAGCEAGEVACCARAAVRLEYEWLESKDESTERRAKISEQFEAALSKLCTAGDAASCWTLAKRAEPRDVELTKRACSLGYKLACDAKP